jgi:uncharacterized protein (TIGR02246 family)
MPRLTLVALAAMVAACVSRSSPPPGSTELTAELTAQFARSAAAWNRGDLDAFVSDYAPDSATSFVSGGHLRHGFDWIRAHYAPGFQPGARRDSLRFEELEARRLSATLALVTARFILSHAGQTTASGPFTLVMERRATGWKILHDHTSSDGP